MIFVGGVSCAGKTHTVERLLRRLPDFSRISASGVLAELGRPLRPLSPVEAMDNQTALATALIERGLVADRRALLDGHLTIETTRGPLPVPDRWFDDLAFDAIVLVQASTEDVVRRRAERGLPWSREEAAENQELERREAERQARRLTIELIEVTPSEVDALAPKLETLVSSPPSVPDRR